MIRLAAFLIAAGTAFAATTYSYDSAGRLSKVDYGAGGSITYTYDNAGNLLSRTVVSAASVASANQSASSKKSKAPKSKTATAPAPGTP
jgi:hypothetical protein